MMGHGCGESKGSVCDEAGATEMTFDVTGSCGPTGRITVSAWTGSCSLAVTGDDVALPMKGNRSHAVDLVDLMKGGWWLEGDTGEQGMRCDFFESGGGLEARCNGGEFDCTTHLEAQ